MAFLISRFEMLIYLDKSLVNTLKNPTPSNTILTSLECIAQAIRKGSHLVTGDRDALLAAANAQGLGLPAKKAYEKVAAKFSQFGGARQLTTTYTVVGDFLGGISVVNTNGKMIIQIPIHLACNLELQTPCEIVFEDLNDRHIYEKISSWYKVKSLKTPNLPILSRPIHGGGNRTYAVYNSKQQQQTTFCLCITDTDKKFPNDVQGPTSSSVANIEDLTKPLSKHLNLDFQEIENLVPLSLLQKHAVSKDAQDIISSLQKADTNGHPESKLYWDFKKGISNKSLLQCNNKMQYWQTALAPVNIGCTKNCAPATCNCFLIKPWPNKTDIKKEIESNSIFSPEECFTLTSLWKNIGSNIVSWTIASTPQPA